MNGKVVAVIALLLAAAAGYVVYSSYQSDWQPPEAVPALPAPTVTETAPAEPEPQQPVEQLEEPERAETEEEEIEVLAEPEPEPEPVAAEPALPAIVQPPSRLNGSDSQVKAALTDMGEGLLNWLTPEEQLRKWVVMVDQMADGRLPTKHRPVNYRKDPFLVIPSDDHFYQDGGNFDRWNPFIQVVTAIDPALLARYYRGWLPLLEQAYAELGKSGSFDRRFKQLLERLMLVGAVPEDAVLVRPNVFYQYADPRLEQQPPLTKWMWRLGADNMLEVQGFLRDFNDALMQR